MPYGHAVYVHMISSGVVHVWNGIIKSEVIQLAAPFMWKLRTSHFFDAKFILMDAMVWSKLSSLLVMPLANFHKWAFYSMHGPSSRYLCFETLQKQTQEKERKWRNSSLVF